MYIEPDATEVTRTERLIATARIVLAAFALLALLLDPSEPERFAALAFNLIAAYLAYAAVVVAMVWLSGAFARRAGLACHTIDLGAFCVALIVTRGTASPFFAFFVFALVSAALRWQWRGTLATAAVALGTFLAVGAYSARYVAEPEFELNRFVMRSSYLVVVAVLLGYLGDHQARLRQHAARVAAIEERLRITRELHDGVIQSLAGAALKLAATRPSIEGNEPAQQTLDDVLSLLATEQRELRRFMSAPQAGEDGGEDGPGRLRALPDKLERYWGLRVELQERLDGVDLPPGVWHQIHRLVHEALVNSARHGSASTARVELGQGDGGVTVTIADDGGGFPFRGEMELDELNRRRLGPVSLMRRVESLGGGLRVTSGAAGARLDIHLPLQERRA